MVRAVVTVVRFVAARHSGPAFRTELAALRFHACRNFRHVGNKLRTEPHRIRRAGLSGVNILGTSSADAAKQSSDRQRQPENEGIGSHMLLPGLESGLASTGR